MRLTSSAVPDEKDDTTVVIGPPFYLSAKVFGKELPIQVRSWCVLWPVLVLFLLHASQMYTSVRAVVCPHKVSVSSPSADLTTHAYLQDTQPGGGRKSILGNELNYFRQLYVENTGKPGDLRVSEVYAGDPAVKGSIFVHQRA